MNSFAKRTAARPLAIILLVYFVLASIYSVVTPLFEASDEQWHYPFVKYLADNHLSLPVLVPGQETLYRQEGGQPPLYYLLGAILTAGIDTSDIQRVRNINPHADIGIIVPDGNFNMAIHDPAVESFPWHGTVLAVHMMRLFSVLLGAITVAMAYLLAQELFPNQRWIAIGATAFIAFNPMFLFISGSVNNDNLSNALASILLVLIIRLLKRTEAPNLRQYVLIGVVAGAGMIAKFNIGFLLPIIGLALLILSIRVRSWRPVVIGGLISGSLTALIGGWWYIRNWQLYGDPTGLNVFLKIVGERTIPANLAQLWTERHTFLMSFWGFFGGVNVPMPDVVYTVFNAIAALSVLGLAIGLIQFARKRNPQADWSILLGRAVTAIWIMLLFVSLLRWTSATWASQGRLMFAALAPLSMWMAVGLGQLGRINIGNPIKMIQRRVLGYATWWFLVIAILAPVELYLSYQMHYPNPGFVVTNSNPGNFIQDFYLYEPRKDKLSLGTGVHRPNEFDPIYLGDYLKFCQPFFAPTADSGALASASFQNDWTIFIHLQNQNGLIVTQRDVYPGQGEWATSLLKIDETTKWCNNLALRIPDYAYAPQDLAVTLGLYNSKTGERIKFINGTYQTDELPVGMVRILPRPSDTGLPNPMSVNFANEADLIGYDVSNLVMQQGTQHTITLYWRARHDIKTAYRVFTQILEPGTSHVFAQSDGYPAEWTRPTSRWKAGEIIEDKHTFTVNKDALPGNWQIVVGMYQLTDNGKGGQDFRRLHIIEPDGGESRDTIDLSRIKIELPNGIF